MLEQLGHDIAKVLESVEFIGIQSGGAVDICLFNCMITGGTIAGNDINVIEEKLKNLRQSY